MYRINNSLNKYLPALESGVVVYLKCLDALPRIKLDVIVDFAGIGTTTVDAVTAIKPGGRIVLVRLAAKEITLNIYELVAR